MTAEFQLRLQKKSTYVCLTDTDNNIWPACKNETRQIWNWQKRDSDIRNMQKCENDIWKLAKTGKGKT